MGRAAGPMHKGTCAYSILNTHIHTHTHVRVALYTHRDL